MLVVLAMLPGLPVLAVFAGLACVLTYLLACTVAGISTVDYNSGANSTVHTKLHVLWRDAQINALNK